MACKPAWSALLSGEVVAQPRAWLHRIVHNVALNTVVRRGYDDGEIAQTTPSPMLTADIAERRLSAAEALAAVAALPEAQRRALTLTAFEGRSGVDAAAQMGVSEPAVRQLVYRARHGVRSAISAVTPLPIIMSALQSTGAAGGAGAAGALSAVAAKTAVVLAVAADVVNVAARPDARSSQHRRSVSAQARRGSTAAHRDSAANEHSGTSSQPSSDASHGSTRDQSSNGESSPQSGLTTSSSSDDATAPDVLSASASDDMPDASTTLPSVQPDEPDASTSPEGSDDSSPAPTVR